MADDVKPADDKTGKPSGDDGDKKVSNGSPGADDKKTEDIKDKAPETFTFDRAKGEYTKTDMENIILGDAARKKELKKVSDRLKELETKNLSDDEKTQKELDDLRIERDTLKSERFSAKIEVALAGANVKPRFAKLIEAESIEDIPGAVKKFVEENPELVSGKVTKSDVKVPDDSSDGTATKVPPGSDKLAEIKEMYDNAHSAEDLVAADKAYDELKQTSSEGKRRRL